MSYVIVFLAGGYVGHILSPKIDELMLDLKDWWLVEDDNDD